MRSPRTAADLARRAAAILVLTAGVPAGVAGAAGPRTPTRPPAVATAAATAPTTAAPATAAPAAAATVGAVRTFTFDAAGSRLGFTVTRPGEVVQGTATQFSGTVRIDPEHPDRQASVTLEVEAGTMVTGNRLRDRTMRNSHLETETHPKIRFTSTSAKTTPGPLRAGEARPVDLEGTLHLHGVERSLRIPVTLGYDGAFLTADGTVSFTLSEFSIPIPKILWFVLDDKVTVTFHAVAKPESR